MATLIIRKSTQGQATGRCDARCYKAKGPRCHCVCGGINHGAGLSQATDITRKHFESSMYDTLPNEIIVIPVQLKLFKGGKP